MLPRSMRHSIATRLRVEPTGLGDEVEPSASARLAVTFGGLHSRQNRERDVSEDILEQLRDSQASAIRSGRAENFRSNSKAVAAETDRYRAGGQVIEGSDVISTGIGFHSDHITSRNRKSSCGAARIEEAV